MYIMICEPEKNVCLRIYRQYRSTSTCQEKWEITITLPATSIYRLRFIVSLLLAGENKESSLTLNQPARESCALHVNNIIARCARTTSATATAGRQEL